MKRSTVALSLALAGAACGGPRQFVNDDVDFGRIRTVAVLPFENVTSDRLSAERVQRIFVTELLNFRAFDVVEPGLVVRAARSAGVEAATLSPDDAKQLGKTLGVQALFVGSVMEFEEVRSGAVMVPRVTVQLRLVSTETGSTIWSISRSRSGTTVAARVFGVGGHTLIGVAQDLVREALAALSD